MRTSFLLEFGVWNYVENLQCIHLLTFPNLKRSAVKLWGILVYPKRKKVRISINFRLEELEFMYFKKEVRSKLNCSIIFSIYSVFSLISLQFENFYVLGCTEKSSMKKHKNYVPSPLKLTAETEKHLFSSNS